MKKEIEVFDYANEIMKSIKTGVLITTKAGDKVNSMTISWGTLGIEWGKMIFTQLTMVKLLVPILSNSIF